jgi:hypothetical protein
MTTLAKLRVCEEHGIRRFLYPLAIELRDVDVDPATIAIRDSKKNLVPCEVFATRSKLIVSFAVSLDPFERKKMAVIVSDLKASIPDPIHCEYLADGTITNRQERFATSLSKCLDLTSVLYDDVEHLSAPVTFQLNGEQPDGGDFRVDSHKGALSFFASAKRRYVEADCIATTDVVLTACKSWLNVTHEVELPPVSSVITMTIPLARGAAGEMPVCDFGLGNGAYAKIDGDAVVLEAGSIGNKGSLQWQIGRDNEGVFRADYSGVLNTISEFSQSLWFHWTVGRRSLAVAITELPKSCINVEVRLSSDGKLQISALIGEKQAKTAALGACLHFLNDIPPIAAATNPASILCPPKVERLD